MFGIFLRQSKPIVMGCLAIILGLLAIKIGVAAFGPIAPILGFVFRGQKFGEIEVLLALVGVTISRIGGGVTLVRGVQNRLGGFHALGKGGLPNCRGGLASFEVRTFIG